MTARSVSPIRFCGVIWTRVRTVALSRVITLLVVILSLGSLWFHPPTLWASAFDVLFRSYVMFVGTVMAHEATHGHLGRRKGANRWWGRIALIPTLATFTRFRRTHLLHHAHTNEPDKDPDHFLATERRWQIPFRAMAMPQSWLFWLRRHGKLDRRDLSDQIVSYVMLLAVYATVYYFVGWRRLLVGMLPALVLVTLLLWYPFAVKTHEGYSTGTPQSRSHNYYGAAMYWFSFGLSMHRTHHMMPWLTWLDIKAFVEPPPGSWWRRWLPQRDIDLGSSAAESKDARWHSYTSG